MKSHALSSSKASDFFYLPSIQTSLFEVKAGAPNSAVLATAHGLIDSLTSMAKFGMEEGIDPSSAFAMRVMLEMVYGLLKALEVAK